MLCMLMLAGSGSRPPRKNRYSEIEFEDILEAKYHICIVLLKIFIVQNFRTKV